MMGSMMRRLSLVSVVDVTIGEVVATPAFPKRIHVRSVKADETIEHAFEVLSKNKVVRAPIVDASGKALCLVDVLDLVKYAVLDVADETKDALDVASLPRMQEPVINAVPNRDSNRNRLVVFQIGDKLQGVLDAFASGRHHVLVEDGAKGFILSQTDILKYLDDQPLAYKNINGKNLEQLGLYPRPGRTVQTIPASSTVGAAYRGLYGSHAAVPIVDPEGRIVGTLSVTDLKYTDPSDLTHLNMNVMDFLNGDEARGAGAPVSVHSDAFIGEVILLLSHAHVTRVWVVDDGKKPVGVVSCTDVIERVLNVKNTD